MARRWTASTDAELDQQIAEARRHSKIADDHEPHAARARYDRKTDRIEVELKDGWMFAFPVNSAQGLRGASPDLLAKIDVAGDGYALHWDELDVHFTVPGLLAGRLGSRIWMREHARRAGSVRSEAKTRAARRNGGKGGRPPSRKKAKPQG